MLPKLPSDKYEKLTTSVSVATGCRVELDDIAVVLNEWPSVDVLCASSNGRQFFVVLELQLELVWLGSGLGL